jgi:hypothetical protein
VPNLQILSYSISFDSYLAVLSLSVVSVSVCGCLCRIGTPGNKGWMSRKGRRDEERERKYECFGMVGKGERE